MQKNTYTFLLLVAICGLSSASDTPLIEKRTLAPHASTQEMAQKKLEEVYNLGKSRAAQWSTYLPYAIGSLERRGNTETGEGFWDILVKDSYYNLPSKDKSRLIYFGPGEYLLPHSCDTNEFFMIAAGACTVASKYGNLWVFEKYHRFEQPPFFAIAAGTIYCLIAHEEGLCMRTMDDSVPLHIPACEKMPDFHTKCKFYCKIE